MSRLGLEGVGEGGVNNCQVEKFSQKCSERFMCLAWRDEMSASASVERQGWRSTGSNKK